MLKHWSVVVVVAVLGLAAWGTSASALSSPKVFSLLDVTLQQQPIGGYNFDRPPVGGDQIGFVDGLYKWAGTHRGARVGHLQALITFVTGFGSDFRHPATGLITAQLYLPGGTVQVQGYAQFNGGGPSKFTLPVAGGTGIYDNVRGYIKVRDLGNGEQNASNIDFHLLP